MVQQQDLNRTFAALADPVRRAVVARLASGSASVSALAAEHSISLPAFMKHLRVLEDAGILSTEKAGRVRTCALSAPPLVAAEGWLRGHRLFWARQLDSLAEFVEQPTIEDHQPWNAPTPRPAPSKSGVRSRHRSNGSTTPGRRRTH